jgi:hypothetical protein
MYLPQLIPHILRVLTHDTSKDRQVTHKMLAALENFGPTLDDYIHLVLPPMVRLFDSADVPWSVRKASLDAIDHLSDSLDFSEYAGRIIHPLVRCIGKKRCEGSQQHKVLGSNHFIGLFFSDINNLSSTLQFHAVLRNRDYFLRLRFRLLTS